MDVVEDMDKENITTMSKTANVTESSGTPKRLPLKNVSMNKANSRLTSCYSPLTPLMMKTPVNQRKAFKLKGPLPIYRDSDQSEPSQLLQKNLMKKHAKETIKHTKEMYENQLSEKDSIIKELQEKLAAAESVSMETDTVTVPETTSTEISETELVMSSSETMVTERDTDEAIDTDVNSSPLLNLNEQLVADEVEVTTVSVTSSIECEENLDVGDECSTDKGDDDEDDLLPSDSELDKFVAEILDTCVQSIKDDQKEMEQNRTKVRTPDISLQQSDQSVAIKENNSVSEVNSISQTIDHSYCRLCEKDDTGMGKKDNDVHSISDACVKSEQEKSSTEAEGKSILVKSIVDLVNSDLVCASEVTCPSEDLDLSMRHCSKCEGQTSSVEMQDTSCSPLKFTGCEDELLTPCRVVESEMNQKHLKDTSCSPCRNPTTDQGCMVGPCLKDADTSMKHLVYSDAMNSPMRILGCDQGTLAVWDTKDADTSTFLIQLNDMANSPVKFPGLDQSTMALWETQDANTSMEQVQMKNAFSSPIKIEMEETGIMASWETQDANTSMEQIKTIDVSSSPMKFLTQEQGVMVETDVVDADTSMLQVEQIDAGSMAVPVSEERYTMTDHGSSVSKETAMTPIKISHKSGQHRMTLQDIRSQHPRVVANHIDTLTLELQRLKKENHGLKSGSETVSEPEKRKPSTGHSIEHKPEKTKVATSRLPVVKRPEKPVVQKKSSVEDTKLRQQIQDWKKKCDTLEVELKAAKKSFAEKSKQAGDKHTEKTSEKVDEIEKLKTDYETELQNLSATLMSSQESNLKMEELYQSTSADLRNSTNQIQILQTSIEKLQNALQEAEKDKIAQSDRIQDMAENDRAAFLEIQTLNAVIKTQDQHLKEFTDKFSQNEEKRKVADERVKALDEKITEQEEKDKTQAIRIRHLQDEIAEYKIGVVNLQRTLDFREEEIDRNEKELFNFREGFVDLESEMEKVLAENTELRECSAIMQGKFQELKSSYQRLQSEMEVFQTSARRRFEGKEVEESAAREELENLAQKMQAVLANLKEGIGEGTPEKEISLSKKEYRKTDRQQSSLVSQILSAAHNQTENTESDQSNDSTSELISPTVVNDAIDNSTKKTFVSCFRKTESDKSSTNSTSVQKAACDEPIDLSVFSSRRNVNNIEQCSDVRNNYVATDESRLSSAFEVVRESAFKPKLGPITSNSACSNNNDTHSVSDRNVEESLSSQEVSVEGASLADYIVSIKEMFVEIVRVANMFETATQLSIGDLKEENEGLRDQLKDLKKKVCYLKAELDVKRNDVLEGREQVTQLEESVQRMADNMMRFSNQESVIKSLTTEVTSLKRKLASLEGDKAVLENHVRELTSHNGCTRDDAQLRSQILALTRKNHKLREKLIHQQEYFEDMESKAAARMKTLQENWKKADEEVYRFDELVERIRETLERNSAFLECNQELKEMLHMIDGQSDFPSSKAPLQPIKTAIF